MTRVCRVLRISRSGFYEARQRQSKPKPACPLGVRLKAAFVSSGNCYGSRRLVSALRQEGVLIGRFKVRSLMKRYDLHSAWKRKFVHTTTSNYDLPVAET